MADINNINDKIDKKFTELLKEGKHLLINSGWDGKKYQIFPSTQDYLRWRTEALNLIRRVCREDSEHYRQLRQLAEDKDAANNSYYFVNCYGVLEAAFNDYDDDLLFDLKALIRADLLEDFLSQAEHLLEKGFFVPAASLAGAVLEDTLRKLCEINIIDYSEQTKIDPLNISLAKAQVYDKLTQKQITAFADLRNNADHGHFDLIKKHDVEDMVKWIRRFAGDHLK